MKIVLDSYVLFQELKAFFGELVEALAFNFCRVYQRLGFQVPDVALHHWPGQVCPIHDVSWLFCSTADSFHDVAVCLHLWSSVQRLLLLRRLLLCLLLYSCPSFFFHEKWGFQFRISTPILLLVISSKDDSVIYSSEPVLWNIALPASGKRQEFTVSLNCSFHDFSQRT